MWEQRGSSPLQFRRRVEHELHMLLHKCVAVAQRTMHLSAPRLPIFRLIESVGRINTMQILYS
jgi:hypothetical protein